ncbi:LPXTG cell wall anchor domain-containing protein [Pseudomonas chlororaphis]|nr:LPXTG cell wall anchor domain-containing protein [Pseudomonas chlororaphis]
MLLLAILYAPLASAVGLGEITVHSALNQPLEAQIALVQAQGLGEGELTVSLATASEFKQAGLERLPFLDDLRFTPILRGEHSVIRVASSKPVNEPFLDFLLQVNQANGRQLREYTLLIDPPGSPEIVPAPAPISEVASAEPATVTQAPPPAARAVDLAAEKLAQALRTNQQLQSQAQELQDKLQVRDEQLARQQQQLAELQRQLSELRNTPAEQPASAAPVAVRPSQPAEPAPQTEGSNSGLLVAAVLLAALLVLLVMRRRRQAATLVGTPGTAPIRPDRQPSPPLASAVAPVAVQEPLSSTPPMAPAPSAPVVGERQAERESSIDVDWDLIAPDELDRAAQAPTVEPVPFNADAITWRLEEVDAPDATPKAEADAQAQKVWPRLR